jgi:CRP-like cAMP-binding protein
MRSVSELDWLTASLRQRAKVRVLEAGETLFRQGDRATAIFAVDQGRLRLIRHTIDNRPVTLHTARAGELFAEAALFADRMVRQSSNLQDCSTLRLEFLIQRRD